MNLPNALTLIRVLLIPVFVILIINRYSGWALVTFGIAGITDGMDGLLARVTHQRTELGAYLDPIADKLLLSAAFITLAITEIIPSWLTVIVITRDVIILVGILVFILTDHRPEMKPSLVSKATTAFQILTILLVLLKEHYSQFDPFSVVALYGAAVLTIISGSHYIYLGARILNGRKSGHSEPDRQREV